MVEQEKAMPLSKVLIVDDNPQMVELLQAYLEDLPQVTVISAGDGEIALQKVATERPDLVLLDIMMPRMSGYEVCRKMKADLTTRLIPVIMVTALDELADIERGVEVGSDDYLVKPIKKVELLSRVSTLLRLRHLQNELDRTLTYLEELERALTQPNK
jgi:two-component system, OmpR family, alkaline phosphatase synthesis response regulator PhoP